MLGSQNQLWLLVNANRGGGYAVLHNCTGYTCQPHIIARLLEAKADPDVTTAAGTTPLMFAEMFARGKPLPIELTSVFERARAQRALGMTPEGLSASPSQHRQTDSTCHTKSSFEEDLTSAHSSTDRAEVVSL